MVNFTRIENLVQKVTDGLAADGESSEIMRMSPALISSATLLHGVVAYDRKKSPIHPSRTYVVHHYVIEEDGLSARLVRGSYDLTREEADIEFEKRAAISFPQYDRTRDAVK